MHSSEIAKLDAHLKSFVVPQTGRALGESGTSYRIDSETDPPTVSVHCQFPTARSGAALIEALTAHCSDLPLRPQFSIDWKVESQAVRHGLQPLAGIANLIAVSSAKGGVGKSTVAINLALALAAEGARTGILDADIYGPSVPRLLGLVGGRPESEDGKTMEPLDAHGVKAMSIGFLVDDRQPMVWRGPMVTSALNQLLTQTRWGELDYLVIDMPPGTGDIQLTLAQRVPVTGALVVTTPQDIALADVQKGLEMFTKVNVPLIGVVENMSLHVCSHCGHREAIFGELGAARLCEEYGLRLLGQLPLDGEIRALSDRGLAPVVADSGSEVAELFFDIAGKTAGTLATTAKDYSRLFGNVAVEENR